MPGPGAHYVKILLEVLVATWLTYRYSLTPLPLVVEVQLVGLKGDPTTGSDSGISQYRSLWLSVLVLAHLDYAKVCHCREVLIRLIRDRCGVRDEGQLIAFMIKAFRIVVCPYNSAID